MAPPSSPNQSPTGDDPIVVMLKSQEVRLEKLEQAEKKTFFRRATTSASSSALFLGLILSIISLYNAFITKPEADRIMRISQFNQAVNAAARTREAVLEAQAKDSRNPAWQLQVTTASTPQILNDIATARAILPDLEDKDVGIPQLMILATEAYTAGDLAASKDFITRAVQKKDATPYLRSEAKRLEGKYFFATGKLDEGRAAYEQSLALLGTTPVVAGNRALTLGELAFLEFSHGACDAAKTDLAALSETLKAPGIAAAARTQIATTVASQFQLMGNGTCPVPAAASTILGR